MNKTKIENIMHNVNKLSNEQLIDFMTDYFDWEWIYNHLEFHLEYLEQTKQTEDLEQIEYLVKQQLNKNE